MDKRNLRMLLMALLLGLTLMPLCFAITYRADVDNGTWSEYTAGLSSTFYQSAVAGQTTYGRDFETDFSFTTNGQCNSLYCLQASGTTTNVLRSGTVAHSGTYSAKFESQDLTLIYGRYEQVADANVSAWFYCNAADPTNTKFEMGYISLDTNTFYAKKTYYCDAVGWDQNSWIVPAGNWRWGIKLQRTGLGTSTSYVDDIQVIRNNTPTFRVNNLPEFCSTTQSCSNQEYHLPSNQLGNTYAVVEYVAGGACTYSTTGGGSGSMTEGLGGMFYAPLNVAVTSADYVDTTFTAQCTKALTATKNFNNVVRLYRYYNVEGGNFETDFNMSTTGQCSQNWCVTNVAGSPKNFYSERDWNGSEGQYIAAFESSDRVDVRNQTTNYAGTSVSFDVACPTNDSGNALYWGYQDDSNTFTQVGTAACDVLSTTFARRTYAIPSGGIKHVAFYFKRTGAGTGIIYIDNVTSSGAKQISSITATNDLSSNYGIKGDTYNFYSSYLNNAGNPITDGNCNLYIDGTPNVMTYNSSTGKYATTYAFIANGDYTVMHGCAGTAYNDANSTYSVTIVTPASLTLTVAGISNVSSASVSSFAPTANIYLNNDQDDVIFSAISQESNYDATFIINNNDNSFNEQYFLYTSSDGSTWVFDESLTFGSSTSYNDPIQKIWDVDHYNYYFVDTLTAGIKKYYKLVYLEVPAAWRVIKGSNDWVNINEPTSYIDGNSHYWDVFNDSNYTNLQSFTRKNYPQLTSTDMNTGFEVQFTAYSSTSTNIQVGYRRGNNTDVVLSAPLTITPTRFSIPVSLSDWNSVVLISTTGTTTARIYLSDYAIIPRSYFTARLEATQLDGSALDTILASSTSYEYIKEGVPFRFKTSAFDKDGDLKTLRVEAMLGSITIKTYEFDLSQAIPNNKIYTWNAGLEGVIDLNGTASILAVMQPLRTFTLKATLINSAGQSVAEQFKSVKLLQYPYFATDFYQNLSVVNKKLGTNPKINYRIQQTNPAMFIGIDVLIYDSSHSTTNPNFSKTIYAEELGCSTLASCEKTILFNEYAWESATNYTVRFTALLKTENKSYTNYLTTVTQSVLVTEGTLETARIFQVFERRDGTDTNKTKYRNDEEISLVLQVRDDTCKNLKNDLAPYMKLTTYDGAAASVQGTGFFPQKFIYDEQTCYNYWFWNNVFYMDNGSLLPDGNTVRFAAYMAKPTSTHTTSGYVLADKCSGYPSDFTNTWFAGSFLMNWLGLVNDVVFGCTTITNPVQDILTTAQEKFITIDNNYSPSALQNESLFCVRTDVNFSYKQTLGDEFVCGVLFLKSEQQIDGFKVMIGNAFSDYAKTAESEKQYIEFDIAAEDIIFNDILMMRAALATEFNTNKINNLGQLLSAGVNKLLPYGQSTVDFTQGALNSGVWIQNAGADINLSEQLNPNKISGLYFFKVSGLKVINQYDFIGDYPELETMNPSMFRSYMSAQGAYLPKKEAVVNIYGNGFDNYSAFKVNSPLIIFEKPSAYSRTELDSNRTTTIIPSLLKFNFIVDMYSNNQQTVQRAFVPITFSYVVPASYSFGNLMKGFNDFMTDPLGSTGRFMTDNWFGLLMLLILAIVVSLIYANVKGGGKININLGGKRSIYE